MADAVREAAQAALDESGGLAGGTPPDDSGSGSGADSQAEGANDAQAQESQDAGDSANDAQDAGDSDSASLDPGKLFEDAYKDALASVAQEDGTGEDQGEGTSGDAAAAAETADSVAQADAGGDSGADDAPKQEAAASSGVQAALRRAQTLREQGRLAELSPTERGELDRYDRSVIERHQADIRREQGFHRLYQDMEQQKVADPAKFAQTIVDHPQGDQMMTFYRNYKTAHPGVTADSPFEIPPLAVPAESGPDLKALALERGMEQADVDKFADNPGALIDAIAERRIAAERVKIQAEEKEAAQKEAQAVTTAGVRVPSGQGGAPVNGNKVPSGPLTLQQSLAMAMEAEK